MGPSAGSGVIGFFVVAAIFVTAAVVVPATIFCLLAKGKKTFIVGLLGLPFAAFLLFLVVSFLFSMNAVKQRRIQNNSLYNAMNAIAAYYTISPECFVRGGEDDEVDIKGFSEWLRNWNAREGVFTDGINPTDASKRRIRVAIDGNNDFNISAFGRHHAVCDPSSEAAKRYVGGLCFFYYNEEGNMSWQTRSITNEK